MNQQKLLQYGHWLSTGLISIMTFGGAMLYLTKNERILAAFSYEMTGEFNAIGFPSWLIFPMGILKILGVIGIAVPRIPSVVREWAYAGLFFNFLFALGAHLYNPINPNDSDHGAAVVSLVLLIISRVMLSLKATGERQ